MNEEKRTRYDRGEDDEDMGGHDMDLVEDFQVGMNSTLDFSEEWTPLPLRFTKKKCGYIDEEPKTPM